MPKHVCVHCQADRDDQLHPGLANPDCAQCKECPDNPRRPISVQLEIPDRDWANKICEDLWFAAKTCAGLHSEDRNRITVLANWIRAQTEEPS